jgi:uncharacterized protein
MTKSPTETHIAVFARAPVEGKVKTRLIPAYGAQRATAIYRYLAERTLREVRKACDAMNATASIWIADANDIDHPGCVEWSQRFGFELRAQVEGDLGERMFRCLETLQNEHPNVSILGTDCPVIVGDYIVNSINQLDSITTWSLISVDDGGYVFIATNHATRHPFVDVAWSTASVMETTRQRFREAGIAWTEPPSPTAFWDIDESSDVERARREGLLPNEIFKAMPPV